MGRRAIIVAAVFLAGYRIWSVAAVLRGTAARVEGGTDKHLEDAKYLSTRVIVLHDNISCGTLQGCFGTCVPERSTCCAGGSFCSFGENCCRGKDGMYCVSPATCIEGSTNMTKKACNNFECRI